MTRFARARGSNASNERVPEDATPWNVMRNQLLERNQSAQESDGRAKFEAMRMQNYEKFLNEQKESNVTKTWCEFDEVKSKNEPVPTDKKKKKKTPKQLKPESDSEMSGDDEQLAKWCDEQEYDQEHKNLFENLTSKLEKIITEQESEGKTEDGSFSESKKKSKSKKKKTKQFSEDALETVPEKLSKKKIEIVSNSTSEVNAKKINKKKKNENIQEKPDTQVESEVKLDDGLESGAFVKSKKKKNENIQENPDIQVKSKKIKLDDDTESGVKNKKKKNKNVQENLDVKSDDLESGAFVKNSSISENGEETPISKRALKRKLKREAKFKDRLLNDNDAEQSKKRKNSSIDENEQSAPEKKKFKKETENKVLQTKSVKEKQRKKPENTIIIINGEKLEVAYYDGFPILAKDMERLQALRKTMISKSIPKSEVDRTMKLERRRAEKSFARIKRKQCFHCRKAGHNLSECPELNKASDHTGAPSSGICFKCGSTEHTHFNCKVVKNQDYKFAQCFICKEQGHISRQCPDNPRGIYPKGGACKECGDVTHLKKDCPKIMQTREDHSMKLEVMESDNIEDISKKPSKTIDNVNKVKHVKF